jgi:chemotaxis protein methyltransferase CheR
VTSTCPADSGFEAIADLVGTQTGLLLSPARRADIESMARRIMARIGIADPRELVCRLGDEAPLLDELIAESTVGETYFFREPDHFAFIRDEVIPEMRRLRGMDHVLRVWSAGCASGEEPYSLAILFEEMGLASRTHIIATDISRAALLRAQEAVYGAWSLRGDGAPLAGRHLRRVDGHFHLAARFRRRVEFAHLNLAQNTYPTFATKTWGMDLVLCRNVLIYLDTETVRAVAQRLHDSLAAGGFLVTGPSDPLLMDHAPFEVLMGSAGVIYRKPASSHRVSPDHAPQRRAPPSALSDRAAATAPSAPAAAPAEWLESPLPSLEPPPSASPVDRLDEVRDALARKDFSRAIELARPLRSAIAAAICAQSLAGLGDVEAAAATAATAAAEHPRSLEIGFLHAVLLMGLERYAEAELALKRVLYLEPSLTVAHFVRGTTLHRLGKLADAARAYRNARDLAARRPADEILPLSDGECASRLAKAAATQLEALQSSLDHGR